MPLLSNKIIKNAKFSENYAQLLDLRIEFARDAVRAAAEKESAEILAAAQNQANGILEKALQKVEEMTQNAYREGYEKGYREAVDKAREEAESIKLAAVKVLEQAEAERKEMLAALENEVVSLSVKIAEKLVAKQLELNQDTILNVVKEALQLLADRDYFVIIGSPREVEIIRKNKEQFMQLLSEDARLKIIGDPGMQPGGCRIESNRGQVDAAIETRWKALLRSLVEEAGDENA
ncbi:FliH/SctL family protein [Desulfolucanica intricata]|uniref:FliH/SctL family protein n=1 Tax=Desulfolucanica intricata TaxID=1285191 RepID=UPI00082B259E|nr:FliH/SctL family protein [Desulfolucanica intricata]